jgi:FkbM family methyltransferase
MKIVLALLLLLLAVVAVMTWRIWRRPELRAMLRDAWSARRAGAGAALPSREVAAPYALVSARHGLMLANRNDFLVGRALIEYGEYSELEIELVQQLLLLKPEGLVVEVGANVGACTVPMALAAAAKGRELVAIEPQQFLFQNLCANLALNGIGNVKAWPYACGEDDGFRYLPVQDYFAEGNFGEVEAERQAGPGRVAVPCVRLDTLLRNESAGLLKIDVKGDELAVLKGAAKLLARSKPVLYLENDRRDRSRPLIEWLQAQGYRLWWHTPHLFRPENFLGNPRNLYEDAGSFNMIGLPRDLPTPLRGFKEIVDPADHPLAARGR